MKLLTSPEVRWKSSPVEEMALLVDGEIYYRAFVRAARRARRSILLSGWQFDTAAQLLRGDERLPGPDSTFLGFLNQLCADNPQLEIHILAWDYSLVYAVEREWMQGVKVALKSNDRIHFEYWTHPNSGGSHHQKYALIDDEVAFVGGLDLCDSRWDTRAHAPHDERRVDVSGEPYRPFHDLQLALRGAVVADFRSIFQEFWSAVSEQPAPQRLERWEQAPSLRELAEGGLPLRGSQVLLSRTLFRQGQAPVAEVEALMRAAILGAESFVYAENQYFTSLSILTAFGERLSDPARPPLTIVVVMPDGGDTPKEDFVLGNRQRSVRYALAKLAEAHGHQLRFLISSDRSAEQPVSTFIHAKLLVVDDQLLCVGSANLTNRSMRIDSELNLTVQGEPDSDTCADIRAIVDSLLCEHAGIDEGSRFQDRSKLVEAIDELCSAPSSKLQHLAVERCDDDDPMLTLIFDPSGELTADNFGDALQAEVGCDDGVVRTIARKAGQRLGVVDVD